jgi:hypothetical protein
VSFLTWAALAVGLLVAVPLIAHLLRRRPPDEEEFAATKLVPARTAVAQRRTAIEDRALFAIRALAILALAALGATPFVKCERLSLAREGGASVALAVVLDDSLSMQAELGGDVEAKTRFARARAAALELLEGLEPGDAVSVIMAGDPPRVALAATTNLDAARATLEAAKITDRGTDLEGAVKIAGELLDDVQHVDKRIVVLSDMAQGGADAPPLEAPAGMKLWVPLDELRGARPDCGVVKADRTGVSVAIRVACTPGYGDIAEEHGGDVERRIEVRLGDETLVDAKLRTAEQSDLVLKIPEPKEEMEVTELAVGLTGEDAIAANDVAPVVSIGGQLRAGVVSDPTTSRPPTGGPPMVEQVVAALNLHVQLRPLSTVPDRIEDMQGLSLLIVDDIAGLTPAQRRDMATWVEKGGVLLLTLGPSAAHAPLGSGFSPMLEGLVRWTTDAPKGLDLRTDKFFGEAADGLDDIAPKGRAKLDLGPDSPFQILAAWSDGAPFLLQKKLGRGVVEVLTLPLDPEQSDYTLRLGFIHLVHQLVTTARALGGTARTRVGQTWTFEGFEDVTVSRFGEGDAMEPIEADVSPNGRTRRVAPDHIGLYSLKLDDSQTTRVAAMAEPEVDLRPRKIGTDQEGESLGGVEASIDISHYVAIALLALMLAELVVRLLSPRWRPADAADGPPGEAGDSIPSASPADRDAA